MTWPTRSQRVDDVLTVARNFLNDNRSVLVHDVGNLADATTALLQPEPRDGLETGVTRAAHLGGQLQQHLLPGAQFAGGNVRVPELREPDAVHLQRDPGRQPTGLSGFRRAVRAVSGAGSGRRQVQLPAVRREPFQLGGHACPRRWLTPRSGCARRPGTRTPPSLGSSRGTHCFLTATTNRAGSSRRGCRALQVQPFTANMLTPESLAELMGGPDIAPLPPGTNLPGPPNAYDETNPPPPPWFPQPPAQDRSQGRPERGEHKKAPPRCVS